MKRFTAKSWTVCGIVAIAILLIGGVVYTQTTATSPERIYPGFLSCSGINGERMCPYQIHYIEFVREKAYMLRLETSEFEPSMMIEDLEGNLLAMDADDFMSMPGMIVFRPRETGEYRVLVSARAPLNEGYYAIMIREVPVRLDVVAELTENDTLRNDSRERFYDIPLEAGRRYVIDMASTDFDPFVKLLNEEGTIVAFEGEGYRHCGNRIVYTPERAGIYRVVATTYVPHKTGAFNLSVCEVE